MPTYSSVVVKVGGPLVRLPLAELAAAKLQSPSLCEAFAHYAQPGRTPCQVLWLQHLGGEVYSKRGKGEGALG